MPTFWLGNAILAGAFIVSIILVSVHSRNTCKEYWLLDSKRENNNRIYRVLAYLILMSLWCYVFSLLNAIIFWIPQLQTYCAISIIIRTWTYLLAKMFMYLVFIVRLHIAYRYSNSIYQFELSSLKITSALVILSGISLGMFASVTIKPDEYHESAQVLAYCRFSSPPITAALFGLYDIIFSIGTLIAFVNPLRKLIKGILSNPNMTKQARNDFEVEELIYVGVRCVILTSVATFSTLLMMVLVVLGFPFFAPIDFIVNMVCMMWMTKYYDDKKYYERVCIITIKCSNWCLGCCCGYTEEINHYQHQKIAIKSLASNSATNTKDTPTIEMSNE